jgi:hypothetical protein
MSWFELHQPTDVTYDTVAAWQNGRTGKVLAVRKVSPRHYEIETFSENYHDDKQPIEYVATVKSHKDNAIGRARQYRSD